MPASDNPLFIGLSSFICLIPFYSKNIILKCLSVHIGSQILDHRPYEKMLRILDKIINKVNHKFEFIDLGGGMGISYDNNGKGYFYSLLELVLHLLHHL